MVWVSLLSPPGGANGGVFHVEHPERTAVEGRSTPRLAYEILPALPHNGSCGIYPDSFDHQPLCGLSLQDHAESGNKSGYRRKLRYFVCVGGTTDLPRCGRADRKRPSQVHDVARTLGDWHHWCRAQPEHVRVSYHSRNLGRSRCRISILPPSVRSVGFTLDNCRPRVVSEQKRPQVAPPYSQALWIQSAPRAICIVKGKLT